MNILSDINSWRETRKQLAGKQIGFVPTMGNLHAGHISLCARARQENDITVVSIFVNPAQFNQASDFESYPRTLEQDVALLRQTQVDYVLLPTPAAMYADDYQVQVTENSLSTELEGEYRPGHFNGMLTVVLKLFNLVTPTRAYFGEKDYQQLLLIKKMVNALFVDTEIVACPTVRAEDGLALSSRNSRLNSVQRAQAAHFPHWLNSKLKVEDIREELKKCGFQVDYIVEKWQRRLGAVWVNDIRLIDNILIEE